MGIQAVLPSAGAPRATTRWVLNAAPDADAVGALASSLRLPRELCAVLVLRGYGGEEEAKRFLRPRLEQLHAPERLLDLERAVERLARAVRARETIMIHGDYDVDGICSTTLMVRAIRALGGIAVPFIPHRITDGYDLTEAGVRAAREHGATVVVTCDCGTSARKAIADLVAAGIDVVVSDHHLPGGALPECLAVLNPKRPGDEYPDKDLAAVGVAFKMALALTKALGGNENVVYNLLDLVALATIADIAPLRGENRVFARFGLKLLAETRLVGLRALVRAAGLEGKTLTAGRVGYILAPRLNAVGRLDRALRGVELLLTESESDANAIARDLEELNRERQTLDRRTLDEARGQLGRMNLEAKRGLVLAAEGWHPGVIGIVASRIVEETGRPAVLVAVHDGEGKGSGRSISAFDLHAALSDCRDLFVRFGGHRAAAGVTIEAARIPAFAERFDAIARERLSADDLAREVRVDLELPIEAVTEDLERLLGHFEPFGIGNAAPVFLSRDVTLAAAPRLVGSDGLRLRLALPGGRELEAMGWGLAHRATILRPGMAVDLCYRVERDEYRGESKLQAKLCDVAPAGTTPVVRREPRDG